MTRPGATRSRRPFSCHDVGGIGQPRGFQHKLFSGHGGYDALQSGAQAVGQGTAYAAFIQRFHNGVAFHERGVQRHLAEFVLDNAGVPFTSVQKVQPAAQEGGLPRAEEAGKHMENREGTPLRLLRAISGGQRAKRRQRLSGQSERRAE